jgi:hypothetical protein
MLVAGWLLLNAVVFSALQLSSECSPSHCQRSTAGDDRREIRRQIEDLKYTLLIFLQSRCGKSQFEAFFM